MTEFTPESAQASPLVVHVDESAVGVGKTERALRRALRLPARWLIAVERLDAIEELAGRIAALAPPAANVTVSKIRSNATQRGFSVRQEIEALPERYQNGHVIALCTHEALMMSDLARFTDWHLVIDEVPNVLLTQEVQSKLDRSFFESNYALTPVIDGWAKVTLTDEGRSITGSDLFQDDSHRHLRLFHQRVQRSTDGNRAVLCNLTRWGDMGAGNVKWAWWSLFSVRELESFATRQCLGNGFMSAISTKLMRAWDADVIWRTNSSSGNRTLVRRNVSVRFFSNRRRAAKSFFDSEKGRVALTNIAAHVAADVPLDRFIWSSNEMAAPALERHLPVAARLRPKQAGSSKWMHCTHAAMIYAAKPNPNMRSVLGAIGVSEEAWIETNEFEAVLQFVTRTSIRDVNSAAHATVYVFDHHQADYLMRFFHTQEHIDADVKWVDLGLDFERERPGPKVRALSPEQAAQKLSDRRAKKATYERNRRARHARDSADRVARRKHGQPFL
ncbi:hypothetical protein [Sphingomonas pruni]|uniref:hypothetical protein n=1 Tax=Sphingomonas pruni TaxID=40683 RepID=UPI0008326F4B|nr:hypothetical protein [Sphingomonas pruni]